MPKAHKITSLTSPKTTILKKTIIIAAAATGLIIAGALAYVASLPEEDADVEIVSE